LSKPTIRLLLGIISARDWKVPFAASFARLVSHIQVSGILGQPTALGMSSVQQCSNMCFHRQEILMQGIKEDWTHVLFLDDDVQFPVHSAEALLAHNLPFVGINLRKKCQHAVLPTAADTSFQPFTSEGKTGLEEISTTTMALFLSDVGLYKKIVPPYFMLSGSNPATDDNFYHSKIRQAGYKIYIDHDLSNQCGHVGDYYYAFPGSQYYEEIHNPYVVRETAEATEVHEKSPDKTRETKEEAIQGAG
jgi:hypothetical protein